MRSKYPRAAEQLDRTARSVLGRAFVDELVQAGRDHQAFDWGALSPEELQFFFSATDPWGPFSFGWDIAERGQSLPLDVGAWAEEAFLLGRINWEDGDPTRGQLRLGDVKQLPLNWASSPMALRQTRTAMLAYVSEPSYDRVREVLEWFYEDNPYNYDENFVYLDAAWFHKFMSALPWQLRVQAGLVEVERLSELEFEAALRVVEWTLEALEDGLRRGPTDVALEMIGFYAALLITREQDPRFVERGLATFIQSGMDAIELETMAQVLSVFECRASEVLPEGSSLYIELLDWINGTRHYTGLLADAYTGNATHP